MTDSQPLTNKNLWERALRFIPGGVNSPIRAFGSVGGSPYFIAKADGAYVFDVEGKRCIDYVQSYGASILGHAHPKVIEAIQKAALDGTSYGAPTEREVKLAEAVCDRVQGCDQIRLVSSGTEAVMSAIRLARGATGRDRIIKFAGGYHGHSDAVLAAGGSAIGSSSASRALPDSAGVPANAVSNTIVAPYNEVPALDNDVAAVIVEPIAANMGLVLPAPEFLEGLRKECDKVDALLIFDEVITGFRVARGGASQLMGVQPDLWCFGKVLGGGLPLAAFGGRREIMSNLAPEGPVFQAGTLSGNPIATAAGLAVLNELDESSYTMLAGRAQELATNLRDALTTAGLRVQVPVASTLVGFAFADHPVANFDDAKASAATGKYKDFFQAMLARGIAFAPGPFEVLFPSLAHSTHDLERTVDCAVAAAADLS